MARCKRARVKLCTVRLSLRTCFYPATHNGRVNAVARDRLEFAAAIAARAGAAPAVPAAAAAAPHGAAPGPDAGVDDL